MFSAHVDRMAENVLAAAASISHPTILEVGCGQGYFLERLAKLARAPLGAALGFDPSFRGVAPAPLRIQARFFDRAAAKDIQAPIDIVVSRHVIEHIVEPVAFFKSLRAALPGGNTVELFLETPCVEWILAGRVVQDFFYEHCSYFTAGSLAFCLERAGFVVEAVEHVFEGQYLWSRARPTPLSATPAGAGRGQRAPSLAHLALAERFAGGSAATAARWTERLTVLAASSKVALWGAAAKGVTFASLVDPDATRIDCLIDVNPKKQGHFTPVTALPIVSAEAAARRGVRAVVIMNPNYAAEIVAYVRDTGLPFELLDV